jgi:anti-sigma factor RsiW
MSCPRLEHEVAAYLDGELDLATTLTFERHLGDCAECARTLAAEEALRAAIGRAGLRFASSPEQTRRLRRTLAKAVAETETGSPAVRRAQVAGAAGAPFLPWRALAALLLVALASFSLGRFGAPRPGPTENVAEEVVTSHVRSLLAGHPADVISTDRHTVKPWFTGRLDYAPAVLDLASQGFPLVGGRLDYLGHHPVAALVYRDDRHVINLFTWPAAYTIDTAGPNPATLTRQGFHVVHWTAAGMSYWAVSDVAEDRLSRFARLLEAATPRSSD